MKHELSLIVALDRNRMIGHEGRLPWHLPDDLKWFKRCTLGKPIVMGRRTWESIGRALPERPNIVISTKPDFEAPGATVVPSLEGALEVARDYPEVMIIGGGVLFAATLNLADRLYLTVVHGEYPGDTFFPAFEMGEWRETFREDHEADERHECAYSFLILERIGD
ncbi:type 3 dihydrofolate reductase [Halofilum ochraceum]|uniref:type 3 dihydrofolate reductase n=1 Tax=Halofilum ochraceum TaxID=1611323 RepID=UPI000829EF3E|nr:type 3 dihydrofolate reductase [Halofilum ochraceum]